MRQALFPLIGYALSTIGFLYAHKLCLEDEKKYPVWFRFLIIALVYLSAALFASSLEFVLVGHRFR
jgi:hypothetical protein